MPFSPKRQGARFSQSQLDAEGFGLNKVKGVEFAAMSELIAQSLSYRWRAPGNPLSVNLPLELVDRISQTLQRQNPSSSQRDPEVGGFLFGRTLRQQGSILVEVDDFEPLECEHSIGPSYLLSESDRQRLARRIRGHKRAGGHSIVGFYRSDTRRRFGVTAEDSALMSAYFSKPSMVLLLIHAVPSVLPTGAFAILRNGAIKSFEGLLEFPFDSTALMARCKLYDTRPQKKLASQNGQAAYKLASAIAGFAKLRSVTLALARQARGLAMQPAALRAAVSHARTNFGSGLPLVWHVRKWLRTEWAVLASMLAIGMIGGVLYQGSVRGAAVPPILQASAQIHDPQSLRERSGPLAKDVAKTPEIILAANVTTADVETGANPLASPLPRKTAHRSRKPAAIPMAPVPRVESAAITEPALPEPPAINVHPTPGFDVPSREAKILTALPPRIPDPFVKVDVDLLPNGHRAGLFGKLRLLHKRQPQASFVPPAVVDQAQLDVPAELLPKRDEARVDVKVYIDATGKVEYGELLSNETRANRDLATLAVFSARRWQFTPARLADEPVSAEAVLHFKFFPDSPQMATK